MARPISRPLTCFFSNMSEINNEARGSPIHRLSRFAPPPPPPHPPYGAWSQALKASFITLKTHDLDLLLFSKTREFWRSKASWRLRFSLPSIIFEELLGKRSLLQRVQKVMVCDCRQRKTILKAAVLNFRVRNILKSAVRENSSSLWLKCRSQIQIHFTCNVWAFNGCGERRTILWSRRWFSRREGRALWWLLVFILPRHHN